jgi:hypothetical protein
MIRAFLDVVAVVFAIIACYPISHLLHQLEND